MWSEERSVCVHCFEEPGLVEFIESKAVSRQCSFCPSKGGSPIAAPIDDVSDHFLECLFTEYSLAEDELGWIGSEGWIGRSL